MHGCDTDFVAVVILDECRSRCLCVEIGMLRHSRESVVRRSCRSFCLLCVFSGLCGLWCFNCLGVLGCFSGPVCMGVSSVAYTSITFSKKLAVV